MEYPRRELHFLEESKATPILNRPREDSASSSLLSFSREFNKADMGKAITKGPKYSVPPPPSFLYSTTAHKKEVKGLFKGAEDAKSEIEPVFPSATIAKTIPTGSKSGIKDLAESSVTVFGYQPLQRSEILKEMENWGHVLEYQEKGKNWMHVRYSHPKEAQMALKLHGAVIERLGVMLGVKKCEDRDFLQKVVRYTQEPISKDKIIAVKSYYQKEQKGWLRKIIEHIFNF